ncbi:MAG TPA: hypothetical protein VMB20_00080 [Candidatus Acidoferrum sp.]|nr:hypothetical protein [Candidatus Acidoferrum sp.]
MNKNEGYGFLVGFALGFALGLGVGFFVALGVGLADDLVIGFAVDLAEDFMELELFMPPAFGDADGLAEDAAKAGAVMRNAAARNDARVFFICEPPSVAKYGNIAA